jgi:peptidoglycan/LPS O-acetylase OafA/YrhL
MPSSLSRWLRQTALSPVKRHGKDRQIHRTSFLDGMRGVAALIVVINHHCMNYPRYFQEPFSLGPFEKGENSMDFTNPMQLPIVRIGITGGAMVPIFFVISGYVLSFRQIRMIRAHAYDTLGNSLFSSAFRRPFRLFLPSIAGIVLFQVTNELGLNPLWGKELNKGWLKPLPTILWSILMLFDGIWLITPEKHGTFLQQLWTIPMEFLGSMVVFMMLVVTSRLKESWRRTCIIACMLISHFTGHWAVATFLAGMLIAELESVTEDQHPRSPKLEPMKTEFDPDVNETREVLFNGFWLANLIMGLLLAGWPEAHFHRDPILSLLPYITPNHLVGRPQIKWFWLGIAAVQIVWCIFYSPKLQKIFTTRIALYLGEISYAVYIVHYHITLVVGPRIHNYANGIFGKERSSHSSQLIAVSFELVVILLVVFWEADLFHRFIDRPCVRFAKWVERRAKI